LAALLALGGALCWGVGDFLGGLAARRIAVLTVIAVSQSIGLAGLATWVWLADEPFPGVSELLPAAGAGVVVVLGLVALYRGLAIGAMGIVAPISAAGPVVPLAVDAVQGTSPEALQWFGIGLILVGIATLSHEPSPSGGSQVATGAGLAIVAALGFGLFFVGIDAGSDESATWAVLVARAVGVSLAVGAAAVTSKALRPERSLVPMLAAIGLVDTGANLLVATATTQGATGIVAVLSSLYPVVTVVLAWLVLGERLNAAKRIGGAIAVAGAAFVAAG
jgi:drug/metabolite transporter (DMT)-like permease